MTAIDQDAVIVGVLYQRAQASGSDRVFHFADAGKALLTKKESLSHGQWLAWINENRGALGFGQRRVNLLIQGAQWLATNWQLADALEEIVTDPNATERDLMKADQIKELIINRFYHARRGTLGRRHFEWYTPEPILDRARKVLGEIDLDPASSEIAQKTVKAGIYFDQEKDGLRQSWHGRTWLNPPFDRELIPKFMSKLLAEWDAGHMSACIALTHNLTDAAWFHDVISAANSVCFTQGRVRFYEPDGGRDHPRQGQALFYFGPNTDVFKSEFGHIGSIVKPEPDSRSRQRMRWQ